MDGLQPGFGVRVTPAGRKLFIAQARMRGRARRITIGTWPEMKVAEARVEAGELLQAMRRGADPVVERKAQKRAQEAGETTISSLAERWLTEHVKPKLKPRTAADYEKLVAQRIKPALGPLTVRAVSRDDVMKLHAAMASTPRRANYTVSTFRALMTFAEDVGLRAPHTNPGKRIKLYREYARERFLSEDEIGKAADAISETERSGKIGPHAAAGLRLALFTGARSGEITAAKWSHVDWTRKTIRLPDSKTNEPRTIHLSDAAVEILKTLPRVEPYIVAGANAGKPFKNLSRAWIVARSRRGLEDVRLHDLRHSYASLAAARGVSLQMIGKLLGHKVAATTMRYAHLARDAAAAVNDELGEAMTAAIAKGEPKTATIIKMKRRKTR
jgi:integrase